ncbi:MAG: 23S rRNA (uracil(1939)-C(5))-methyltransferase RlmD [Clostridia bacterium]|nr:23S rRNA (uracil(1939)-C(5))-methyltransferase RlmD [Clostridia bacterium]MDD4386524.1 23S rRNA (uracil(1939)-C(5))-methyltransferase RlmD [Clostridia bacterium]
MNGEQFKLKCININEEGKGIVKLEKNKFYIPYLIDGETANIEVFHTKKCLNAKLVSVIERSKYRVFPKCPHFYQCGGCQMQHMSYEGQCIFKQNIVNNLLDKYCEVNKIIGMEKPYNYRNKVHSTFAFNKKKKIISGFYEESTHNVISIDKCMIQDSRADNIISSIREMLKSFKIRPYDEDTNTGLIRHILIKVGFDSKQIMIVLVVSTPIFPGKNNFIKVLLQKHPEISTVVLNINNRNTSMILGDYEKVLYGKGFIEDTLCGCTFQISPKSFYQINPIQTEILYNKVIEMSEFIGNETVIDTYCGIGTISLIMSKKVKKVLGVELNKDAIKDAIQNAKRNNIINVNFFNADSGDFITDLVIKKETVDVVIMDPPRNGSDEKFLSALVSLMPKKVIYISCNPVTLERDISYLTSHNYKVTAIQPVDMFPQTNHIECVVKLEKI